MASSHTPPPDQRTARAARVRAARAYADKDQSAIADVLGLSVQTVKRLERGLRDISEDEMRDIAELCDVPLAFLVHGFPDQPLQLDQLAPLTRGDADWLADQVAARLRD